NPPDLSKSTELETPERRKAAEFMAALYRSLQILIRVVRTRLGESNPHSGRREPIAVPSYSVPSLLLGPRFFRKSSPGDSESLRYLERTSQRSPTHHVPNRIGLSSSKHSQACQLYLDCSASRVGQSGQA